MKNFYLNLTDYTTKQLVSTIVVAYTIFFLIILLIFVPTTAAISETGYSTTDLQQATTSEEVEDILRSWQDVLPWVYLQYVADYIFLIAGLIGNTAIFALLGKKLQEHGTMVLSFIGFVMVFLSRGSDALENTLTLILIIFPDSYPQFILPILPLVPSIKFMFVGIVYLLILINEIYYLFLRYTS